MKLLRPPGPHWPPLLATRGPGTLSRGHAHHGQHILLAAEGTLKIRVGTGPWRQSAGLITAPDVPHSLDGTGRDVLLVFLDPESDVGRALAARMADDVLLINSAVRDEMINVDPFTLMGEAGPRWLHRLLTGLGIDDVAPTRAMHPRIRKALRLLHQSGPEDDVSLETIAAAVNLSPGRFMHAFTESVGIPLRPWLAWLKLQRAAATLVEGQTIATAAHAAGFSDAAHLTRTFKSMLGLSPSELRNGAAS